METKLKQAICRFNRRGISPFNQIYTLAKWFGVSVNEIEAGLDAERDCVEKEEQNYYENLKPAVDKSVAEWLEEFPLRDRREMRRRYLVEQIREARDDKDMERLSRLVFEAKVFNGEIQGITPELVKRARDYSLLSLLKHRNFMAVCVFHNEKTPSMNIKNNFYYCHGCGAHGDVIDFVMKTKNLSFKEAIKILT